MITSKVCLRSDYHDPLNQNPTQWDIVSQDDGHTVIKSPGDEKTRVKTDALRWADDEKYEDYLHALYKRQFKKAAKILNEDPLLDAEGTRAKPSLYWGLYISRNQKPDDIAKTIDWLIKRGVSVDQRTYEDPYQGWSLLAHAIHEGGTKVAEKLLERGASFQDATTEDQYDLLTLAASTRSFNTMAWLLDKGFDPLPNFPHLDLLEYDDSGYSANSTNTEHSPILHRAAQAEYETDELARVMFEHVIHEYGISQLDQNGKTAIETARPENLNTLGRAISDHQARHIQEDTPSIPYNRQGPRL